MGKLVRKLLQSRVPGCIGGELRSLEEECLWEAVIYGRHMFLDPKHRLSEPSGKPGRIFQKAKRSGGAQCGESKNATRSKGHRY